MAKQAAAAAKPVEEVKTEVAVVPPQITGVSLAAPAFLQEYAGPTGAENIDVDDVSIPRLKLAQGLTPEVKEKLVEDGDMFHSITKSVICRLGSSIPAVPIVYSKEYILWRDRTDGGGIFDRAIRVVENGDVRYKWMRGPSEYETKIKGAVKVKWKTKDYIDQDHLDAFGTMIPGDSESGPAATAHFNYICYLPTLEDVIAVSFSRSSARKAKDLNAMLKMGGAPMFARVFSIGAVPDQNDSGDKYWNYGIVPAGFVDNQALFNKLQKMHTDFAKRTVVVDFSDETGATETAAEAEAQKF